MTTYQTQSVEQTQARAAEVVSRLRAGVICLSGDLGAGKTTFAQGLLKALGAEGPYTSPTFTISTTYDLPRKGHASGFVHHVPRGKQPMTNDQRREESHKESTYSLSPVPYKLVHHIDAYRIGPDDLDSLGWAEMVADPSVLVILEWPERVKAMIPPDAVWVYLESGEERDERTIKIEGNR